MPTIFPGNPSIGDEFDNHTWNGSSWVFTGVDLSKTYAEVVSGKVSESVIPDSFATQSYVTSAINSIATSVVDTSPAALDTLNELAAAVNDNPNFFNSLLTLLDAKFLSQPGIVKKYAGASAPNGWFLCEGQEILISSYQGLYDTLTSGGTVFPYGANTNGSGGVGSTHFRLPNLKGRIPVGLDSSQSEFNTLGETGGAKTVTLDSTQLPVHSHSNTLSGNVATSSGHTHNGYDGGGDLRTAIGATASDPNSIGYQPSGHISPGPTGIGAYTLYGMAWTTGYRPFNHYTPSYGYTSGNSSDTTVTISNASSGGIGGVTQAHNNLQPYIVVNYIIKY